MKPADQTGTVWIRLGLCMAILAIGIGGFVVLKKMKKPPVQSEVTERPLSVEALRVEPVDIQVEVTGFGEIRSRTVVPLSVEVSGKVASVHARLEEGEIIQKGEILLTIDERDYRLDYEAAESRLKTMRREYDLAAKEYKRLRQLYEQNKVGTLSSVENAESAVNAISERITQVEQTWRLAVLHLERSVIRAPFNCRLAEVMVEENEYVVPGQKLLQIVDDAALEIIVSLDSRDVLNWLRFDADEIRLNPNWFERLASVECLVTWAEDEKVSGKAVIDRVVRFDPKTRTILVAVRLDRNREAAFPLVAGMFCKITIPGRILASVFALPRQAVTFENKVYVEVENRLQTRPVRVVRLEPGRAIVTEGLAPGDIVITTRLEQPLENALLAVKLTDNKGQ